MAGYDAEKITRLQARRDDKISEGFFYMLGWCNGSAKIAKQSGVVNIEDILSIQERFVLFENAIKELNAEIQSAFAAVHDSATAAGGLSGG